MKGSYEIKKLYGGAGRGYGGGGRICRLGMCEERVSLHEGGRNKHCFFVHLHNF